MNLTPKQIRAFYAQADLKLSRKEQQMQAPFAVGSVVENFGAVVRVEALDSERGLLVVIIPWVCPTRGAQGGVGQRYYAQPAKCKLLRA
jgi:hypothetical protein